METKIVKWTIIIFQVVLLVLIMFDQNIAYGVAMIMLYTIKVMIKTDDGDARAEAIDELVKETMKKFTEYELTERIYTVTDCKCILRDVAEKLKEGVDHDR